MLKKALLARILMALVVSAVAAEHASGNKLDGHGSNLTSLMRLSGQGPPPSPACMPGGTSWPCPPSQQPSPSGSEPTPVGSPTASTSTPTATAVVVQNSAFRQRIPGKMCADMGGVIDIKVKSSTYSQQCKAATKPKYQYKISDAKSADGDLVTTAVWVARPGTSKAEWRECDHMLEAGYAKLRLFADLAEHMRRTDPVAFPDTKDADQRICNALRENLKDFRKVFNGYDNMIGVPMSVNQFKADLLGEVAQDQPMTLNATQLDNLVRNMNKAARGIINYDKLHRQNALTTADQSQRSIIQLLSRATRLPYSIQGYPPDAWRKITDADYAKMTAFLESQLPLIDAVVEDNCDTNPNGSTEYYTRDKSTNCCSPKSLAKKEFKPSDQWYQRPVPVPGKRKCNGDPCDITKQCCLKADGMTLKTDPDVPSLDPSSAPHRRQLLNRPILAGRQSVPMPGAPDESCQKSDKEPEDDNSKPDLEGPAPLAALVGAPAVVAAVAAWMNPLWLLVAAAATAAEARKDHQKEIDDNLASFAALAADKDHQDDCRLALDQLQRILKQMRYEPTPAPSCGGAAVTAIASAPAPTSLTPQQIYSMGVAAITNDPLAYTATHSASSPVNGASTSTITSTPLPTVSHPTPAEIYSQGVTAIKGNSTTAAMTMTAMPSPNATAAAPLAVIH